MFNPMIFMLENFMRKQFLSIVFLLTGSFVFSQSGTYELKNKNGSYCYISFQKAGVNVTAEIFAWWNTQSGQTGSYFGKSQSKDNTYLLKSDENDPDCKVSLLLDNGKMHANFDNCNVDHLPQDFNGDYRKITDATAGDYIVSVPKSYFYEKPDNVNKKKIYLIKGNKVTLNIDSIIPGKWINVYYVDPQGKEYRGYMALANLKKI